MIKSIIKAVLIPLYKKFNLPRMSCYGCLKDDCLNRTKGKNKICDGYISYKRLCKKLKKKNKTIKYKPRRKKHNYDGLQEHHIIFDEFHDYKG